MTGTSRELMIRRPKRPLFAKALMLTQTVEYALRAMVCLAGNGDGLQTRSEMVEKTRVPSAYLAKVMRGLTRAGLVHAQRGPGGGFSLARPPRKIRLIEIVNAVEPIPRIRTCPLGIHGPQLCALHRRLDQALASFEQSFSETTLGDIVAEPSESVPLCEPPAVGQERKNRDAYSSGRQTSG